MNRSREPHQALARVRAATAENETRTQAARCMDCGIPYCHTGCPVNNQIPDWNDLVYRGDWEEAARNLHSTNNFPEVTGRICPAPCEASCTLNLDDNPVTIKTIECAISDRAYKEGWIRPEPPRCTRARRSRSSGSGPAGLACAQQLARVGHEVHVFEKYAKGSSFATIDHHRDVRQESDSRYDFLATLPKRHAGTASCHGSRCRLLGLAGPKN